MVPQTVFIGQPPQFILSAKTLAALETYVLRYIDFLKQNSELNIGDICYTLQTGRELFPHVIILDVNSIEELLDILTQHNFTIQSKDMIFHLIKDLLTCEAYYYRKINLPTYPFERQRYWVDDTRHDSVVLYQHTDDYHPFLQVIIEPVGGEMILYQSIISSNWPEFVQITSFTKYQS